MDTTTAIYADFSFVDLQELPKRTLGEILYSLLTKAAPKQPVKKYADKLNISPRTWREWKRRHSLNPIKPALSNRYRRRIPLDPLCDPNVNTTGQKVWIALNVFASYHKIQDPFGGSAIYGTTAQAFPAFA